MAERPRVANWSLRAALTRYGQPQPQRTSDLIEVLRRIDVALKQRSGLFERHGDALWAALGDPAPPAPELRDGIELLGVISRVDEVGERLAAWARDPHLESRPDEAIDAVVAEAGRRLDELGVPRVPREEQRRPPRAGGSRGV